MGVSSLRRKGWSSVFQSKLGVSSPVFCPSWKSESGHYPQWKEVYWRTWVFSRVLESSDRTQGLRKQGQGLTSRRLSKWTSTVPEKLGSVSLSLLSNLWESLKKPLSAQESSSRQELRWVHKGRGLLPLLKSDQLFYICVGILSMHLFGLFLWLYNLKISRLGHFRLFFF